MLAFAKRAVKGIHWPLHLAVHVNKHPGLGPTQPHSADITDLEHKDLANDLVVDTSTTNACPGSSPPNCAMASSEFLKCQLPFWKGVTGKIRKSESESMCLEETNRTKRGYFTLQRVGNLRLSNMWAYMGNSLWNEKHIGPPHLKIILTAAKILTILKKSGIYMLFRNLLT